MELEPGTVADGIYYFRLTSGNGNAVAGIDLYAVRRVKQGKPEQPEQRTKTSTYNVDLWSQSDGRLLSQEALF